MATESTKRPLITKVILFTILIFDELLILFVDRVVGQVHVLVVLVYL